MFDFVGNYIDWATRDGWTMVSLMLLGLGILAVALAALAVLAALICIARAAQWFLEGVRVRLSGNPQATREAYEVKRAANRAAYEEFQARGDAERAARRAAKVAPAQD